MTSQNIAMMFDTYVRLLYLWTIFSFKLKNWRNHKWPNRNFNLATSRSFVIFQNKKKGNDKELI